MALKQIMCTAVVLLYTCTFKKFNHSSFASSYLCQVPHSRIAPTSRSAWFRTFCAEGAVILLSIITKHIYSYACLYSDECVLLSFMQISHGATKKKGLGVYIKTSKKKRQALKKPYWAA